MELHFSFAVELGQDILVATLDTVFTPKIAVDGYSIRIAQELADLGYEIVDGKITLPGRGLQAALILRDDSFKELRVVKPTQEQLTASAVKAKATTDKVIAELGEIIKMIDPKSELGQLIRIVVQFDYDVIKNELTDLAQQVTDLDLNQIQAEIADLRSKLDEHRLLNN